ncbi:hypothetical protein GPECTOR_16g674 [Gonium pectorale]|uniref:Uncharacterized protein n=1 Tax=Gonium pectorale TaxID=33097 RepID=A0A150GKX3_GONPE|nr:hypothetical protein GPECTOR_16g674 [Gonium pectorale]|eukprot:KXZ50499.1 hypothetical protein GPECTOR_16g674 [Gonium pectorale]
MALPLCGDGACSGGETCRACPADCGVCGPGAGFCGDGVCNSRNNGGRLSLGYGETCSSCAADCGQCTDALFCGDGVCSPARHETAKTCSADCGDANASRRSLRGPR